MKKLMAGLTLILGGLSLTGCHDTYKGIHEGYPWEYRKSVGINQPAKLFIYSKDRNGGYILFEDENGDGRFEEIDLSRIQKGDPVEELASLKTGQEILEELAKFDSWEE